MSKLVYNPYTGEKNYVVNTATVVVVDTIEDRDKLYDKTDIVWVKDASGDPDYIIEGGGLYLCEDNTNWILVSMTVFGDDPDATVKWSNVQGKPDEFPPTSHEHRIDEVEGLQTELNKIPSANVNGGYAALVAGKIPSSFLSSVNWIDITGKPVTFQPSPHEHDIHEINQLQDTLDAKGDMKKSTYDSNNDGIVDVATSANSVGGKSAAAIAAAVEATANIPEAGVNGGFAPLEGGKIPASYLNVVSWTDIDGKPNTFVPSQHGHPMSEVQGLTDALDASGDMKKAVYDADADGIVDVAKTVQYVGSKSATEVVAAVNATSTIPKPGVDGGYAPLLNGVIPEQYLNLAADYTINGEQPDESGNFEVTAESIGAVESVNGKTGTVVLSKSDLGLGNVNNTSDADKPISNATKWYVDDELNTMASAIGSALNDLEQNVGITDVAYNDKQIITKNSNSPTPTATRLSGLFDGATYDGSTGVISFSTNGGAPIAVNLGKEDFLADAKRHEVSADDLTDNPDVYEGCVIGDVGILMTMVSGTKIFVKLTEFVDTYTGGNTEAINVSVSGYEITANLNIAYDLRNQLKITEEGLFVGYAKIASGTANGLVISTASGDLQNSGKKIGGTAIAAVPDANTLATEKAVSDKLNQYTTYQYIQSDFFQALHGVFLTSATGLVRNPNAIYFEDAYKWILCGGNSLMISSNTAIEIKSAGARFHMGDNDNGTELHITNDKAFIYRNGANNIKLNDPNYSSGGLHATIEGGGITLTSNHDSGIKINHQGALLSFSLGKIIFGGYGSLISMEEGMVDISADNLKLNGIETNESNGLVKVLPNGKIEPSLIQQQGIVCSAIELPIATEDLVDHVYLYLGETENNGYIKGNFYRCIEDGSTYQWIIDSSNISSVVHDETLIGAGTEDSKLTVNKTTTISTEALASDNKLTTEKAVATSLTGKVSTSLTINDKPLTSNINLDKNDIGLGNVNNTSDIDKPISTATQAALDAKASTAPATQTAAGLMSAADKKRLDELEPGGSGMTDEERARLLPVPSGSDKFLKSVGGVTGVSYNDADTIYLIDAKNGDVTNKAKGSLANFVATAVGFAAPSGGAFDVADGSTTYVSLNTASGLFGLDREFTIDIRMKASEFFDDFARNKCLIKDSSNAYIYLSNDQPTTPTSYGVWMYNIHSPQTVIENDTKVLISIDVWYEGATRMWAIYVDGALIHVGVLPSNRFINTQTIFGYDSSGGGLQDVEGVSLYYLRISKVARYKGVAFTSPGDAGYPDAPDCTWQEADSTLTDEERERLLPSDAVNGDLAIKRRGYGGNDSYTKMLIRFDDPAGASDSSPFARPLTNRGVTSTGAGRFGSAGEFDGTGYLTTAYDATLNPGSGDFAVDWWTKFTQLATYSTLLGQVASGGMIVHLYSSGVLYLGVSNDGYQSQAQLSPVALTDGTYHHIAISRRNGIVAIHFDGVAQTVTGRENSTTYTFNSEEAIGIGSQAGSNPYGAGFISELRLSIGVSRYDESDFIPASEPYGGLSDRWDRISLPELRDEMGVGGGGSGDVTSDGDNAFSGANSFTQSLTVGGRTVDGLYPDRNPVAQVPVLDAALGVCHYLDETFTEISLAYPVWHLAEIRALVCSVNPAITGTVEIMPYIDDVAQTPVTINVGADWGAVTIPLAVETGSIRLVRTGGTLADGGWVTAAFRGITAMVTI